MLLALAGAILLPWWHATVQTAKADAPQQAAERTVPAKVKLFIPYTEYQRRKRSPAQSV